MIKPIRTPHLLRTAALILLSSPGLLGACDKVPSGDKASDAKAAESPAEDGAEPAKAEGAEPAAEGAAAEASAGEEAALAPPKAGLEQLLAWLAPDALSVSYDRLEERFDPAALGVVFAIPPKSADLLEERQTLDEALDIVFDGEAEPHNWLGHSSLAYTVQLSKSPYFVRPLTQPAEQVTKYIDEAGFHHSDSEGYDVWLPDGSFPWRITLLEGGLAAFVPVDVPGAALEPLKSAQAEPASEIETELARAMKEDPTLSLMLVSAGPLVHFDTSVTIAQVLFAMREVKLGAQHGYEGQVKLMPVDRIDECAEDLRKREHPEENAQIQALMKEVAFVVDQGAVVGGLGIEPDKIKHMLLR